MAFGFGAAVRDARWWRLFKVALAGAGVVAAFEVLPSVLRLALSYYHLWVPWAARPYVQLAQVLVLGYVLQVRPARWGRFVVPAGGWERAEGFSGAALRRLPGLLVATAGVLAALWLPHFLLWPWWPDLDHFALMAQSWDAGVRPYRDAFDYNFPGPVYLMWVLGKTFGWGHTTPALAVDAAMLAALGGVMAAWSRSRFGGALPGLVGYLGFFLYYLSVDSALVAQRDWQATFLAVCGLMAVEAWPGGRGLAAVVLGGALCALALAFRPYPVLFLPAFASAVVGRAREGGGSAVRFLAAFGLAVGGGLVVAYAPLLAAGVADDFVRSLAYLRPGAGYNRNTFGAVGLRLLKEMGDWRYGWLAFPLAGFAAAPRRFVPASASSAARTWALALAGVACYRPLGPVQHDYLGIPLELIAAAAAAAALGAGLTVAGGRGTTRLFAVLVVLAWFNADRQPYCDPQAVRDAVNWVVRGRVPEQPLPGARRTLHWERADPDHYNWNQYQALLAYLARASKPTTRVANALRKNPHLAINGPAGRLTPFPSPAGLLWFRWVGPGREPEFCRSLAAAPDDTLVVWSPSERPDFRWMWLRPVMATVRRHYRPEAKFGAIEVWRKVPAGVTPPPLPPAAAAPRDDGDSSKYANPGTHGFDAPADVPDEVVRGWERDPSLSAGPAGLRAPR